MNRRRLMSIAATCGALLTACTAVNAPRTVAGGAAHVDWIARGAMYEVFTRDFSPAGNFQGVIDGLPRIEATGPTSSD